MKSTQEEFVRTWMKAINGGENQTWISKHVGVSRQTVATRAAFLRRKGVELPKLPRGGHRNTIDSSALNKIIKEYK